MTGVCRVDSDSVSCWDASGHPDAALTTRVQATLAKMKSVQPVAVHAGSKLRLVVVETVIHYDSNRNTQQELHPRQSRDGFVWNQMLRSEQVQDGDERYSKSEMLFGIEVPPAQTAGSIFARKSSDFLVTKRLEPVPGSTCQVGDWTLTLTGFKKLDDVTVNDSRVRHKVWQLQATMTGPEQPPSLNFFVEDKAHHYIQLVDENGKPATQEQYAKQIASPRDPQRIIQYSIYTEGPTTDGKVTAMMYVDPSQIGGIGVSGSQDQWIEIAGIPLEPIREGGHS